MNVIRVTKMPPLGVIESAFKNKTPLRIKILFPGTTESLPFVIHLEEKPKFDNVNTSEKRESVSVDLKVRFESGSQGIVTGVTYKLEYRPFKTNRSLLYLNGWSDPVENP